MLDFVRNVTRANFWNYKMNLGKLWRGYVFLISPYPDRANAPTQALACIGVGKCAKSLQHTLCAVPNKHPAIVRIIKILRPSYL